MDAEYSNGYFPEEYELPLCVTNSLLPVTPSPLQCVRGCGLTHHAIEECPLMRRVFGTQQIQYELPPNIWKYSQLPKQIYG